ncbi:MAG TPA: hypothetical protein VE422_18755 [Terriglobia bacterium]|nr:hypothetical protein [Terriglobia bacterium]
MRYRLVAALVLLLLALPLAAQNRPRQPAPSKPTPRWPDGRVRLGMLAGEKGIWVPNGRPILAEPETDPAIKDGQGRGAFSGPPFPGKPKESEVPFQPWARALYEYREANLFEPHTRCKPSGGPREFITPGGTEFLDLPDLQTVYIFDVAGPQSFRIIYLDGRPHPMDLIPSYYGHSVGHWEGDTLVVDTVGFNEKFWMERQGAPHTSRLHLIERFTRTDFNDMKIEVTIDDPGAYTRTWTTGFFIRWSPGTESQEYICQDGNKAATMMIGNLSEADRSSRIVP